ncbi:hypothetical protein G7054_g11032 [Neopestalotiopsis clavispora]|nr:hypothetical protein G7054_g11032 [Neopestalotiopsis clavispora]
MCDHRPGRHTHRRSAIRHRNRQLVQVMTIIRNKSLALRETSRPSRRAHRQRCRRGPRLDQLHGHGPVHVAKSRGLDPGLAARGAHPHGAGAHEAAPLPKRPEPLRGRDGVAADAHQLGVGVAPLHPDPVQVR